MLSARRLHVLATIVGLGLGAVLTPVDAAGRTAGPPPPAGPSPDVDAAPAEERSEYVDTRRYRDYIVKFRPRSEAASSKPARGAALDRVGDRVDLGLRSHRALPTGAVVVRADEWLGAKRQGSLVSALEARADIIYAHPDYVVEPYDEPTDPDYAVQQIDQYGPAGLRLPHAWNFSKGAGVDVAVIDTGVTSHPDLDAVMVGGADFINDPADARDGDSWDTNPRDEGNWQAAGECSGNPVAKDSSWHGTHVAGTIAARWNGIDGVGVAPAARIQAVRALGRCGGNTSDIASAMLWAAGESVGRMPDNRFPAEVINMSLGSDAGGCNDTYRDVLGDILPLGVTVVVAAGNDDQDAARESLASCNGVVAVAASTSSGAKASFSNYGDVVDVTAPGSAIWSTVDTGNTVPEGPDYGYMSGTSMAAPHVAGLYALIRAEFPSLTTTQILTGALFWSGRPVSGCNGCGYGIPDAGKAFEYLGGGTSTAPSLEAMFQNYGDRNLGYAGQCGDWSGGDGTQSVVLPNGKRVWFFADTYLGDPTLRPNAFHTSMIRNSMVVQNGSSLRTITGGNTCMEKSGNPDFFANYARTPVREDGNGFYWGGDSMVVGDDVVKFHWRNVNTPDKLWQETHTAVTVQPVSAFEGSVSSPQPRLLTPYTPFKNHPVLWGMSLLQADGYVYIYGVASMFDNKARRLYLARTTKADLADFSTWRYRTGTGSWSAAQTDARPVDADFEPTAVFSVRYLNDRYWLVQQQPGVTGGDIVAHPSTTPWGFDREAVRLYDPPYPSQSPDYYIHYDARIQDGLSSNPDRFVVSYNLNSLAVSIGCRPKTDHVASIYRPRFVSVPKTKLRADAATVLPGSNLPQAASLSTMPASRAVSAVDNGWYNAWSYASHCPPLNEGTSLSATSTSLGKVNLSWSDYGRDMWYWIERRDATAGTGWSRFQYWATGTTMTDAPVTTTAQSGHTFEYRVVPYANFGGAEAPKSNVVSLTVAIAKPAAPTNVRATAPSPKNGTVTVRWDGVTYPSNQVYYQVFYWDKDKGQTESTAAYTAWLGESARSYTLTNLTRGHLYGFDVRASNLGGFGPRSANATATP